METTAQPGSLDSEAGILCSTFDQTGTRLITGEADKTIKIWKEDENAYNERDNQNANYNQFLINHETKEKEICMIVIVNQIYLYI